MCVWVNMYGRGACMCRPEDNFVFFFLSHCPPYFETESLVSEKSLIRPGWLASKLQASTSLCLRRTGI